MRSGARQSFIYFIRPTGALGPVKIGCTHFIDDRLTHLMHWSPVPLEVVAIAPGDFRLERFIHNRFAAHRLHKEWFAECADLTAAIERVVAGEPLAAVFGAAEKLRTRYGRVERHYVRRTDTAARDAVEQTGEAA